MIVGVDGAVLRGSTGVSRYLRDLLAGAAAIAPEVSFRILLPSGRRWGAWQGAVDDLAAAGIERRELRPSASWALLAAIRAGLPVPIDMASRASVMVLTRYTNARTLRAPNFSFVYDLAAHYIPESMEPGYARRVRRAIARTVAQADRIGLISEAVRDELVALHPAAAGRTVVVRPMVPKLPPMSVVAATGQMKDLGLEPGFVLHVGTIEPRKNLPTLLDAHSSLPAATRHRHPLVLLGGRGWESSATFDRIAGTPDVHWLESPPEGVVAAAYATAAMVVYPTLYEGFGLPVLEALAAGCPIACSDLPVLREAAGEGVDRFDPRDASALRDLLEARLGETSIEHLLATRRPSTAVRSRDMEGPTAFVRALVELVGGSDR